MSSRVTKRRQYPMEREHLNKLVQFWRWLYEAADKAVTAYLNRPRIGDTRVSKVAAVFRPRDHFRMDGKPKARLSREQAEARCAGEPELHSYRGSLCREWHVGHRRAA